ncbi:MAG: beta-phosphoglucomutase family hydrolase [Desulfuromonadales bacterium]|nr:beta-phosphoglucomutase family hydrolase [Desulfuromonadales bacterium]
MNDNTKFHAWPGKFDAVLFDLDGVLTATAAIHAVCWKRMFDEFLKRRALRLGESYHPFDLDTDYKRYVDGKLRYDGVRSFLEGRGIALPQGAPADLPEAETVCALGNRKDAMVKEVLETQGVGVFQGSLELLRRVRQAGLKTAVVSASKNCQAVLQAVGIEELFEIRMDGIEAGRLGLAGKPAPDTFLKAAELLSVPPARAVVIEDAISGVQAGRAGGFGLVVGIDRDGNPEELQKIGADVVVRDLAELLE